MDWPESWRDAFRIELRAEAIGLASRGWPVLPGTYPSGTHWAGRASAAGAGPVPIHENWSQRAAGSPEQVADWWGHGPYSLLAATGTVLHAIEVGGVLGRHTAAALRSAGGPAPIVATPAGRWLFLTSTAPRQHEFTGTESVSVHGQGSWIPLPPTPYRHGIAHWRVKPEVCGWRLPEGDVVAGAVVRAMAPSEQALVFNHAV